MIVAYVSFYPWYAVWRRQIAVAAKKIEGDTVQSDSYEVWLQTEITPQNILDLDTVLEDLFSRWIAIFKSTGSFPKGRSSPTV